MAIDINDAFVKQFESEVHVAYQRMGSKIRNTVRTKAGVKGASTTFQKVGKGEAGQKSRHGNVPVMTIDHAPVECTLQDWYAADYIDKLDELRINHDERLVVANSSAYALGRKTDTLLTEAMNATTLQTTATGAMTSAKINEVFETFGETDVPDDGERYFAVSPQSWVNLLGISAFSDADFIGADDLPYKGGMVARRWLGFMFYTHSGLPLATGVRSNFAYHKSAVGHAIGQDVTTELNYVPEKVSHLTTSYMAMGAVLIDGTGVYNARCTET